VHFAPEGYPGSLPLSGLLFLRRGPEVVATAVGPLADAPSRLLGTAFLPYLDRAERLERQLEVMSALARTVPLAELVIAPGNEAPELAGIVRDWAGELP
jgi:hypothetical protein